jgi:hypothetical protein
LGPGACAARRSFRRPCRDSKSCPTDSERRQISRKEKSSKFETRNKFRIPSAKRAPGVFCGQTALGVIRKLSVAHRIQLEEGTVRTGTLTRNDNCLKRRWHGQAHWTKSRGDSILRH